MSVPALYPPAIHKLDGTGSGKWSGVGEWKLVVHTTESRGIPSYSSGAIAPHLTFWPARGTVTQHSKLTKPAEAVLTFDDDQIFQIETICYSDRSSATKYGGLWVGDLTDAQLQPIADFVIWLRRYVPLQVAWPGRAALNYTEANAAGFRFTNQEFYSWPALLGHQHLPKPNVHWDPGAFPWTRLLNLIKKGDPTMDNGHPYQSHGEFRHDHDIGELPNWSPWSEYLAAGGSSVPESGTWAFTRADMAWVWQNFIEPLSKKVAALDKRLAALENRPPGSVHLETETVNVVKGVRIL